MANSALRDLLPLIILLIVLLFALAIGFVVYTIATDVAGNTQKKMEKKNISLSRDGMKVKVKEVTREQQEDSTQQMIMKVWNNASWPAYKSKLGWGQSKPSSTSNPRPATGTRTEQRKPYSQSSSS